MNFSKTKTVALVLLTVSAALALLNLAGTNTSRSTAGIDRAKPGSPGAPVSAARVCDAYGQLPLAFELNRGQADEATNFRARGAGYTLSLSPTEATFLLARGPDEPSPTVLRMNLVGANPGAPVEGLNELEGKVNYLIGNDPTQWRTNIPTFSRVRYSEVYRGIDVVYYGNQRRLEYDFVVGPGRGTGEIVLEFTGAERVEVEAGTGDLLIGIGEDTLRQHKPLVYQETEAGRREIESRYALLSGGRVGFEVGDYDRSATLVIDPVLVYSTYLGGTRSELGNSIAVDSAGNAYVTGFVSSTDFPTIDAVQGTAGGGNNDAFITKLNATGTALVYSTYLGGSDRDVGFNVTVDSEGSAYVTGFTSSDDFPTANAFQATRGSGDNTDAFVTKLSTAGSSLVYSTYLGGDSFDSGNDIEVDSAGNVYLVGDTGSTNFPTANPLQSTQNGSGDAYVTKLNAAGSALIYSTYLGGSESEGGTSIAVDSSGNVYVTGYTFSANFPIANAFQSTYGGDGSSSFGDAFVTKINAAGSALIYSTYLGGNDGDAGYGIAIDSTNAAYVTGNTRSTNFPTANALQSTYGGSNDPFEVGGDAFVTKVNAAGSALVYSTYLGGSGTDGANGIAVDSAGNAYVTGDTFSTNFPTANALQSELDGEEDAFVTHLNAAGSAFVYSTYLGGSGLDGGGGIAVDSTGDAYVAGFSNSSDFPTTAGAFDQVLDGGSDAVILKIRHKASLLLNIATRMRVLTGDSALIGGFIITGSEPKRVIIRGIGPSLTSIQGALANPILELFDSNQVLLGSNDDWKTNQAEVEATTIPPTNDFESAIVITLAPGAYTAVLRGQNNGIGIGVVEVYDLNAAANSTLANISSRGFVDTGDNAMIGGFIVGGGSSGTRVLVRGIGPSLASFFPDALANPTLELRNADGSLIRENDDWRDSQEAEIQDTTIPPSNNLESAIIASVANGNYTAILRGVNNTIGVAVVEVYNVQ